MEGPWEGDDAFLACVLGAPICPLAAAGKTGRGKAEESSREGEDSGRRALVDADLLRVVHGFGPSPRKKRSTRQRRLVVEPFSPGAAAAAATSPRARREQPRARPAAGGSDIGVDFDGPRLYFDQSRGFLRFLLQKELRKSDVGSLGRMVLPKKEAEAHLPVLIAREGIYICMEDMETSHLWTFKYRYWPNNKSRMYILEHTGRLLVLQPAIGDFVRRHGLKLGDYVMLYRDDYRQRYVVRAKKAPYQEASSAEAEDAASKPSPSEDHVVPDAEEHAGYLDVYLPMADELCLAMDTTYAFSADFTVGLSNGMMDSSSTLESLPSLGSIENLSLDDFS